MKTKSQPKLTLRQPKRKNLPTLIHLTLTPTPTPMNPRRKRNQRRLPRRRSHLTRTHPILTLILTLMTRKPRARLSQRRQSKKKRVVMTAVVIPQTLIRLMMKNLLRRKLKLRKMTVLLRQTQTLMIPMIPQNHLRHQMMLK